MTYPTEPESAVGQILRDRFEREAVRVMLLGNPLAVDQCVIELERRGFCYSDAWTPPLLLPENTAIIQPQPGEVLLYKRWYQFTA